VPLLFWIPDHLTYCWQNLVTMRLCATVHIFLFVQIPFFPPGGSLASNIEDHM
jgi:hypothetical protein